MRYKLVCICGAYAWVRGSYGPSVNALELDDRHQIEWDGGDAACVHDDSEVMDEESDDE